MEMKVSSANKPRPSILLKYGIIEAHQRGEFSFLPSVPPTSKEFDGLIHRASAESREVFCNKHIMKHGEVWGLKDGDIFLDFAIQDLNGRTRRAVPFWPSRVYAEYVAEAIAKPLCAEAVQLFTFIDTILLNELPMRKLLVAIFWIPGKRTAIRGARQEAISWVDSFCYRLNLEPPSGGSLSDADYMKLLKAAYARPMKAGPRGKLP